MIAFNGIRSQFHINHAPPTSPSIEAGCSLPATICRPVADGYMELAAGPATKRLSYHNNNERNEPALAKAVLHT